MENMKIKEMTMNLVNDGLVSVPWQESQESNYAATRYKKYVQCLAQSMELLWKSNFSHITPLILAVLYSPSFWFPSLSPQGEVLFTFSHVTAIQYLISWISYRGKFLLVSGVFGQIWNFRFLYTCSTYRSFGILYPTFDDLGFKVLKKRT